MADNARDLKLKLSATGGDAAAKEVKKVENAVSDLGSASKGSGTGALGVDMSQLTPAWATAGEAVEEVATAATTATEAVTEAKEVTEELADLTSADIDAAWIKDLGKGAAESAGQMGGLGGKIESLIGKAKAFGAYGALFATAFKAGWEGAKLLIEKLDEIEAAANRSMPTLVRTSQAAAVEASNLAAQTKLAAERAKDADKAYEAYAQRLRKIADQQAALTDAELGAELAQIDLDELQGRLTEAEAIEARFAAKRSAEARKRAAEIEAIETELNNRRQQNALDEKAYKDAADPVIEARSRLGVMTSKGARGVAGLDAEQSALRAAIAARDRGFQSTTDPAELDKLDKAVSDAQKTLAAAYEAMVANAIKAFEDAKAKAAEAGDRLSAGREDQRRLENELANATTGTGAAQYAAQEREAALRLQMEQERLRQEQAAAQQRAADEAARAQQQSVNQQAASLAKSIEQQIAAAPNAGGDTTGLLTSLQGIAGALQDGTSAAELAELSQRLANLVAGLGSEQQAARSTVQTLAQKVAQLESQFANRPGR